MTLTVGRYTFGAWLRRGIGRTVNEADTLGGGDGVAIERATVPVDVQVNAHSVHKDFALFGPGDLIGMIPQNVVRTEPHAGVTDFEPNYLAYVEFYDEDLVWRYTPARAAGDRLRPWLALVVLEEDEAGHPGEFTLNERLPLPTITVKSTASLPPHTQTWAWAHVHVNDGFDAATDFERFLESLHTPDHPNSDRVICRLVSPRHLAENTAYAAFVVPAFETGRLAGLEQDTSAVHAQRPAWTQQAGSVELPVYFQWRFRTGENEDFESLVKKLEPRPVDRRVGVRPMDGEKPGWGLTAGTDIGPVDPPEKPSVVGLEGALKSPTMRRRPAVVDASRPFFSQLDDVLNFPEQLRANPATADLPVVSPPIYGEHHALRHTVDASKADWLDDLNRDPRTRVSAGFGTRVVQQGQERYVARAWKQVQRILDANRRIRLIVWAMQASVALHDNLPMRFSAAQKVVFYEPLLGKVRGSATTLRHQLSASTLPPAAVSGAMRRLVRPRGVIGRRVAAADPAFSHAALVDGMASGELAAAAPKPVPSDLATDAGLVADSPGTSVPAWLAKLLAHGRGLLVALLIVVLVILLVIALLTGALVACAVIGLAVLAVFAVLWRLSSEASEAAAISDPAAVAAAVERAPPRPDFHFTETDPVVAPEPVSGSQVTSTRETTSGSPTSAGYTQFTTFTPVAGGGESAEGRAFRAAATALNKRLSITFDQPAPRAFDMANAGAKLSAAVDPRVAFPKRLTAEVRFSFAPLWLLEPEHLVPAMAYPDFDDPMYEKLRDLSSELLLPNIELIPQNTLTLLLTNPPFIEAYLAGCNCEFGKELLWREYPTDRRGSYFRQFWDVKGIIAQSSGESAAELSERSKDIIPMDEWRSVSALGAHRNPKRPAGEQVVLTVRGELLKKYPNTLIYAQRAHLAHDAQGKPTPAHEPVLAEVATSADVQREIKFPVFKAVVEPDICFFGLELSLAQARGAADPKREEDDWGYYFVIQQLPGEPRFGMDVTYEPDDDKATPITWDDLAWTLFEPGQRFVSTTLGPRAFTPAGPGESPAQWGTDSARMASILFQKPVMIAVHAKEMLDGLG